MLGGVIMNFDYVETVKNISKDRINLTNLQMKSKFSNGWNMYELNGLHKVNIWINPSENLLKVKSNWAYYWQGHNFNFPKDNLINAINHTSNILNVNLLDAEVKKLEFGSVIQIEQKAEEVLLNHIGMIGRTTQPFYTKSKLTGKYFSEPISTLKLYNAGLNIRNKLSKETKEVLRIEHDFNSKNQYLKVEVHYKKPEIQFKMRNILLNDIIQFEFMDKCKEDLISTYSRIWKSGQFLLPEDKKQINASTIPLLVLYDLAKQIGVNPEQLIKDKVKSFPDSVLSKYDKKARLTQLKGNQQKLTSSNSIYDLTDLLINKPIQ